MLENEVNDNRQPNITWKDGKEGEAVCWTLWNVLEGAAASCDVSASRGTR